MGRLVRRLIAGMALVAMFFGASGPSVLGQSSATPPTASGAQRALFAFAQTDPKGLEQIFIFELRDPARIAKARAIIANSSALKRHVQGTVISRPAPYNPGWSFHLAPESIVFFEIQIEVCDANVTYVQDHLDEVGGSFLPKSVRCPWSSRLVREVS